MKALKKLLALTLAVVMVLSLSATAFAEETVTPPDKKFTISADTNDDHTYEVYQIFTGDWSEDKSTLSNIKWGKNGSGTLGETVPESVLTELAGVSSTADNQTKLATILKYANLTAPISTVTKTTPYSADPGYYLIKDAAIDANADDAYTTYIVQVVDDVTIARKAAKPTVDKQVHDEEADAETGHSGGWGETADHEINETFQFKLTATLPADEHFADYNSYKVVFHDSWSEGVTYDGGVKVEVNGAEITVPAEKIAVDTTNRTMDITIDDIIPHLGTGKALKDGATIVVTYNAHLNENAVLAPSDANRNKVSLEYSNNPNAGGESSTGKTPEDIVYVFTYEVPTFKYTMNDDGTTKDPKEGAGFKLYDSTGAEIKLFAVMDTTDTTKVAYYRPAAAGETPVDEMFSRADGHFDIHGLDAGTYTLKETTTPDGYNTAADTVFVIGGTHSENADKASASVTHTIKVDSETTSRVEILNSKGIQLPETGGIGTTIFYIVGGLLTLGAVVLLVTKKKMSAE